MTGAWVAFGVFAALLVLILAGGLYLVYKVARNG